MTGCFPEKLRCLRSGVKRCNNVTCSRILQHNTLKTNTKAECCEGRTSGEACALVAFGELDVEEGDESLDVVVAATLQVERSRECEVRLLHRVDVYLLTNTADYTV